MNDYVPSEFYLGQNYPNPFTGKTTIKYCVAYKTKVKIMLFGVEGNMIEKLVDEEKDAGTYEIKLFSNRLSPGIYCYKMFAGTFSDLKGIEIL